MPVTPQGDPTGAADGPGSFRSELVLRPGWWRHFSQEIVALGWVAVAIPFSWAVWWQWGRPAELLLVTLIITAWSLYVGGSWASASGIPSEISTAPTSPGWTAAAVVSRLR